MGNGRKHGKSWKITGKLINLIKNIENEKEMQKTRQNNKNQRKTMRIN